MKRAKNKKKGINLFAVVIIVVLLLLGFVCVNSAKVKEVISTTFPTLRNNAAGDPLVTDINLDTFNQSAYPAPVHEHIYEKKYDSFYHWDRCKICGQETTKIAHTLSGNGGSKTQCDNYYNTAYREVCDCGYQSGPQLVLHGRYHNWETSKRLNYGNVSGTMLANVKQITRAEFNEIFSDSNPDAPHTVGGQPYTWEDPDGDGYGWVFCGGLVLSDTYETVGIFDDILGTNNVQRQVMNADGNYRSKGETEFGEAYRLIRYISGDETPTLAEFLDTLPAKNTISNDNLLYGMKEKYSTITQAQWNSFVTELKGYQVRAMSWGYSQQTIIHPGHSSNGTIVYSNNTCYDSTLHMASVFNNMTQTECDLCGSRKTGRESFEATNWLTCNTGNQVKRDGETLTCAGHPVTGYGNELLGTVYCTFRRSGHDVFRTVSMTPADGATGVFSAGIADGVEILCNKADRNAVRNDITHTGTASFTKTFTYEGVEYNQTRTVNVRYYNILIDDTNPTAYGYTNATTNNNYWAVIGNGTPQRSSIQASIKVTFQDERQYTNNTMRVRIYDSDGTTLLRQPDGKTEVPLVQVEGTDDRFTGTITLLVETTSTKNIYVEGLDATGNASAKIPMQVSYIDAKAPELAVTGINNNTWAKRKTLTLTGTDAFNKISIGYGQADMVFVSNTTYNNQRQYEFTGDVYDNTGKQLIFYAKDEAGNLSSKSVNITRLDNTKPTITNAQEQKVNLDGNKTIARITVTANDKNTTLNAEGSGVKTYFISQTNTTPAENAAQWQTSNVFEVKNNGTYYVWAKDQVGNISNVRSIVINDLTAPYLIQYYLETQTANQYTVGAQEQKTATTGSTVSIPERTFTGFTENTTWSERLLQGVANADGTLVLKRFYTRNSYNVTYSYTGTIPTGASTLPARTTQKYEAQVTVAANATAPGYNFSGWSTSDATISSGKFSMPAKNVSISGRFTAKTNTPYKVEHYKQNIDGSYPTTASETENLTGTTDTTATATQKTYTGFTFDSSAANVLTGNINGQGNLVLKVYYSRNSYNVTYSYTGTVPTGASTLPTGGTYKYEAQITVAANATAPGYNFSGWSRTGTFNMPASNVSITGSFTARNDTAYKVEHYRQNLDGSYPTTPSETENLQGTTDTTATAVQKTYTGFTFDNNANNVLTGNINGQGTLVLKVYYYRNSYDVSYSYDGITPPGATELPATRTYKYEEEVTVAEDASAPGYDFDGWNRTGTFNMPASDVEIKGSFSARGDTVYRVEHYLRDSKTLISTLKDREKKRATTGTTVTAVPKEYPGYELNLELPGTKQSGVVSGYGDLVLRLYYSRNIFDYKVEYYFDGVKDEGWTEIEELDDQHAQEQEVSRDPAATVEHNGKNYMLVSTNHTITLSSNQADNVIRIYYELDENGDGISDKYQVKINFDVENGTWDDGTSERKTQIFTLYKDGNLSEEGTAEITVPSVGQNPQTGYKTGHWNTELPTQLTKSDDGQLYWYTYEISEYNYRVEYYFDGTIATDLTENHDANFNEEVRVTAQRERNRNDIHYILDGNEEATLTISSNQENNVIKFYYDADGSENDPENPPDGIPDKYQIKVHFNVVNGNWNDGTNETKHAKVTLYDGSNYSTTGTGTPEVPPVGEKPNEGFEQGTWDVDPNQPISKNDDGKTFTYTYKEKKYPYRVEIYIDDQLAEDLTENHEAKLNEEIRITVDKNIKRNKNNYIISGDDEASITIEENQENNVIKFYYDADGVEDDEANKPDQIPDKYQIIVEFDVANGKWNDGTSGKKYVKATLYDGANYSNTGTGTLEVPKVGSKPNDGYEQGSWNEEPKTNVSKSDAGKVYKYTYKKTAQEEPEPEPEPEPGENTTEPENTSKENNNTSGKGSAKETNQTNSVKGDKDPTTAKSMLPQTGQKSILIIVLIAVIVSLVIFFKKKKYTKVVK